MTKEIDPSKMNIPFRKIASHAVVFVCGVLFASLWYIPNIQSITHKSEADKVIQPFEQPQTRIVERQKSAELDHPHLLAENDDCLVSSNILSKIPSTICFDDNLLLSDKFSEILGLSAEQRSHVNNLTSQSIAKIAILQQTHGKTILHTDAPGATIILPVLPEGSAILAEYRTKLRKIISENKANLLEAIAKREFREYNGNFGTEPLLIEVKTEITSNGKKTYHVSTSYGLQHGVNVPLSAEGHVDGIESEGGKYFSFTKLPQRLEQFFEMSSP